METLLHDIPTRGKGRVVLEKDIALWAISILVVNRDLKLVELRGPGLTRLNVKRTQLIDTPPRTYPATRAWGAALAMADPDLAGLSWTSRLDDRSRAFCFLAGAGRVKVGEISLKEGPYPLAVGPMRGQLDKLCSDAGLVIAVP